MRTNRFWVHVMVGLSAVAGAAILSSACAHDDSSFFLQGVLAPPEGSSTGGCMFTADPTQAQLFTGVLDVEAVKSFSDSYQGVFLAGDQLIPQGNQPLLMTETSRIEIQGAVVTVTDAAGGQLAYYTTYGAGFADPANGTTPGYGTVQFMMVDPATVDKLRSELGWLERETIVTYTKAFGTTLGGDHVESNTFQFPITVCRGCLINYDTDPTQTPSPNCYATASSTASTSALCFFGQDEPFDCHDCLPDPYCLCGEASCTGIPVTDAGTE
jgi:hypothetical protein